MDRPVRQPTAQDLDAVRKSMSTFRDSGCRIWVSKYINEPIWLARISGHWIIAPSEDKYRLGFDFSEEHRKQGFSIPLIRRFPYDHEISVHVDHEDYFIYFKKSDLYQNDMSCGVREMTAVDMKFMLKTKAFIEVN
jgi:hypothetical protein